MDITVEEENISVCLAQGISTAFIGRFIYWFVFPRVYRLIGCIVGSGDFCAGRNRDLTCASLFWNGVGLAVFVEFVTSAQNGFEWKADNSTLGRVVGNVLVMSVEQLHFLRIKEGKIILDKWTA